MLTPLFIHFKAHQNREKKKKTISNDIAPKEIPNGYNPWFLILLLYYQGENIKSSFYNLGPKLFYS